MTKSNPRSDHVPDPRIHAEFLPMPPTIEPSKARFSDCVCTDSMAGYVIVRYRV